MMMRARDREAKRGRREGTREKGMKIDIILVREGGRNGQKNAEKNDDMKERQI